jgi:DNA-binding winged helix-turn-helix (wHTH) protein
MFLKTAMQAPLANVYEFGAFQLDPARRVLRRLDGTPVPLTPKVFETLLYMVEHHDAVLDKERIMEAVWPDSIVEENNLAQAISKLRQVFGERPASHNYIATVPGRGYRFVAEVNKRTKEALFRPEPEHAITEPPIEKPSAKAAAGARAIEAPQSVSWLPVKMGWLWMV